MTILRSREGVEAPAVAAGGVAPRPVVLATLSVRVHPEAERMAIESALDTGAPLIIANMLWLPPHPTTLVLAREVAVLPHEEDLDAVRQTAARAAARGVKTELLRISSRRPLAALLELSEAPGWWCWGPTRGAARAGGGPWPRGGSGSGPGVWCGSRRGEGGGRRPSRSRSLRIARNLDGRLRFRAFRIHQMHSVRKLRRPPGFRAECRTTPRQALPSRR
jgi:hypothetical protein